MGGLEKRVEHVGGALDIIDQQRLVDAPRRLAFGHGPAQPGVVVTAAADGAFVNLGIRRYALDTLLHVLGQLARADEAAAQIVQPGRLAEFVEVVQGRHWVS